MMSLLQIFLASYFVNLSQQLILTTPCASVALADCNASGYCTLSSDQLNCQSLPCYMINEIAACRDPTSILYDAVSCFALGQLDLRYDNVCSAGGILDYAFVRLPLVKTGSPIYSTTGMTLAQITAETNAATRNNLLTQLFSLNLQTATNTQLNSILALYISYSNDLLGVTGFAMVHPYYLEKAIFQSLQNLRDDTDPTKVRLTTLTNIWSVSDILLQRLRTYRKYYATSYFFINFAHTQFNRLYLSVKARYSVFSIKWSQYTANGYVQIITLTPKQFSGFSNALSDAIMINLIQTDGTVYALDYTLIWLITDSTVITCTIDSTSWLHVINDRNQLTEVAPVDIHTYCNLTSKRCDIPSTAIPAGQAYYIACV